MILNSRNNLFLFNFPIAFIPDEIKDRYSKYLNRIPGNMITRPIDFINYSVQSVNLPAVSYDPATQVGKHGRTRQYRASVPEQELMSKELTITLQLLDGNINYWILLDTLAFWYQFPQPKPFIPEGTSLRILDSEGNIIVTSEFRKLLFKEIGSLEMSFSNNSQDFTTFDCTFGYDELITKVELD